MSTLDHMNTLHRWFRSGEYALLGHIMFGHSVLGHSALGHSLLGHNDVHPDSQEPARHPSRDLHPGNLGVLIVPPFGWEDVCSYRPLRFLGAAFASNGIPAMRFDLPGTGDSSGEALDANLVDAWIASIGDAAGELRAVTGVRDVAVVGVHMGAMLALAAGARGANVEDLILWGPSASGRSVVRELRAFSKLARAEYSNGAPAPPQTIRGLEAGGFLLAPGTQSQLEALDLSVLPAMPGRRILILSRDELPSDPKLAAALESSGCVVEFQAGAGYAAMMAIPEEALPPTAAVRAMLGFLERGLSGKARVREPLNAPDDVLENSPANDRVAQEAQETLVKTSQGTIVETVHTVERPSGSCFGILCSQRHRIADPEWCVLFLNPGAVRHTGPNRMWVEASRRLALRGVTSLRMDLAGVGESDGEINLNVASLYQDRLVDQVESAMESVRRKFGAQKFAVLGLCSGAFWAFHAALRNPAVRLAILLNPRLFFWDPEVDRRRVLRRTARLLTESTDWTRLMRGYVSLASFRRVSRIVIDRFRATRLHPGPENQIHPEGMAEAWAALERNQNRLTLIFTEGEPLLREMEEEGYLSALSSPRVNCIRLANCGHTFRPLWAQQAVHELIDRELDAVLHDAALQEAAPANLPPDLAYLSSEPSQGGLAGMGR